MRITHVLVLGLLGSMLPVYIPTQWQLRLHTGGSDSMGSDC